MIAIFSFEGDKNTNYLIDWLTYYGCAFKRVNLHEEDFRNIKLKLSNNRSQITLKLISGESIDLSQFDYFYVRGKGLRLPNIDNTSTLPDEVFHKYIKQEYDSLTKYFYSEVNKKSVGCFNNDSHSKLIQYAHATEVGLSISKSFVHNNKNNLLKHTENKCLITKAIENNVALVHENEFIVQRVQRVKEELMEDSFFPSFFQYEIDKLYEIRLFYLDGDCYAIKFHSDSDKIDMRDNYAVSQYEPYKMPIGQVYKISKLMNKLGCVSGSLDFIRARDGKYYFLEVNLNGQYDWVSHYGNYNLHQKIAHFLYLKTM